MLHKIHYTLMHLLRSKIYSAQLVNKFECPCYGAFSTESGSQKIVFSFSKTCVIRLLKNRLNKDLNNTVSSKYSPPLTLAEELNTS